jgi:ribose-phosphate pyrophosphokinase
VEIVGGSFAQRIAEHLEIGYIPLELRVFPDKEVCPRVMGEVGKETILALRMEVDPNNYLARLLLTASTLRDSSAQKITCVVPYLIYARQDKVFKEGESYSLKYMLDSLYNAGVDEVITVNSHAQRWKREINISKCKVYNLNAMPVIAKAVDDFDFVMGPDAGTERWVKEIYELKKVELKEVSYGFFEKSRNLETGRIEMYGKADVKNKNVLIVDDIISSGKTMLKAVENVKKSGAEKIWVAAVHGLFRDESLRDLENLCDGVFATNTLPHDAKEIDIIPLICGKIKS